jgi:phenylacetate-coenzyme A ligase PaaK-like adenylate-forming protein
MSVRAKAGDGFMKKSFMPSVHAVEELKTLQLEGLKWTVKHAYHGSRFYKKRLDEAGIKPENIHSLDDLQRLPFTTAEDLRDGYPHLIRWCASMPHPEPLEREKCSAIPRRT